MMVTDDVERVVQLITAFISATFLFSITGVGEKVEKFSGELRCLSQAKVDGADLQTWSGKSTRTSLMLSTWSSSCSLASLYFSSYFCISTIEPNLGNVSISKPLLNSKLVCRRILWGVAKLDAYFYPGSNIKGFFVKVVVVFSFYVAFQVPNGTFPFLSPNLTHDIYVVTTLQCAGILYMKIEYSRGCCCKISIQHDWGSIWKDSLLQKTDNSVNFWPAWGPLPCLHSTVVVISKGLQARKMLWLAVGDFGKAHCHGF